MSFITDVTPDIYAVKTNIEDVPLGADIANYWDDDATLQVRTALLDIRTFIRAGITPAYGGTGMASYAVGDLLYASGATTLSKLADIATGNALLSGGVTTAPAWGKIGLTTHVAGTLPIANGGTNKTTWTANAIAYASASNVLGELAPGTGVLVASGAAPSWSASPTLANLTLTAQLKAADGTAGAPGMSFSADLTKGFHGDGANQIGVAIGGTERARFTATSVRCDDVRSLANNGFFMTYTASAPSRAIFGTEQAGYAMEIQSNRGTADAKDGLRLWCYAGTLTDGNLLALGDGGSYAQKWAVDFNGRIKHIAGNEQSTVGGVGGASALPATPRGYFKITDSGGTVRVVPYYDQA